MVDAAANLTRTALEGGWAADGKDGLVYTVDWDGAPVSRLRLHWPICEGIQTCAALVRVTGDPRGSSGTGGCGTTPRPTSST